MLNKNPRGAHSCLSSLKLEFVCTSSWRLASSFLCIKDSLVRKLLKCMSLIMLARLVVTSFTDYRPKKRQTRPVQKNMIEMHKSANATDLSFNRVQFSNDLNATARPTRISSCFLSESYVMLNAPTAFLKSLCADSFEHLQSEKRGERGEETSKH